MTLKALIVMLCIVVVLTGVQAQAQETTPPLVRQRYNGNWPSEDEAQKLIDELYYQRAIHAYMTMLPALNVIGMFTDFFQRTITDVGAIGPDRARGGLYLLLPDCQGHVPGGYFTFTSSTYNVFLFFRTVMAKGKNGPDPAAGSARFSGSASSPWTGSFRPFTTWKTEVVGDWTLRFQLQFLFPK